MPEQAISVAIKPGKTTTVKTTLPQDGPPQKGLILAHGMANDMDFPLLIRVAEHLAARGIATARYNFLYREAGKDRADSADLLLACLTGVYEEMLSQWGLSADRVFVGGKSLGGRISALAISQGLTVAGAVYLGFPLHPPGRPEQGREDLIESVCPTPQYFVAGTRDHLCPLPRLQTCLDGLSGPVFLHVIEGGDHSFVLPKDATRTQDEIDSGIARTVGDWLTA